MKAAFQKPAELLADIRRVASAGTAGLWWLGQSGYLWVQAGRGVLFDPYLSDSLTRKYAGTPKPHTRITELVVTPQALAALGLVEVITSSHNHTDHLDAETLLPFLTARAGTQLVIPAANREFVLQRLGAEWAGCLVELDAGASRTVAGIELHAVTAAHPRVERDDQGRCRFLGYVLRWQNRVIYHSGDTLLHDDLAPALRPYPIEVALLPINGDRPERQVAGNLDGPQAARLAKEVGAGCVIPCHYDLFEFNTASPDEFVAECRRIGQPYRLLRNGEGWNFERDGAEL